MNNFKTTDDRVFMEDREQLECLILNRDTGATMSVRNPIAVTEALNESSRSLGCYKSITKPDELEVGKFYWVRSKNGLAGLTRILICCIEQGEIYLGNRMWATEENPQAFEKWDIAGPINPPEWF